MKIKILLPRSYVCVEIKKEEEIHSLGKSIHEFAGLDVPHTVFPRICTVMSLEGGRKKNVRAGE